MGIQEFKAWVWRLNFRQYLYLRWFDGENRRQMHHVAVRDNGKEYFDYAKKDWPVQTNKKFAYKDEHGMLNICWVSVGPSASMSALPMAFEEQIVEMALDHDLARERGSTIDLEEFHRMAHKRHNEGWFGAGRERLLMILLGGAIGGLVVAGIAGSYFSSQVHFVSQCYHVLANGTETQFVCPAPHVAGAASSVSSSVSSAVSSASTSTSSVKTIVVNP